MWAVNEYLLPAQQIFVPLNDVCTLLSVLVFLSSRQFHLSNEHELSNA